MTRQRVELMVAGEHRVNPAMLSNQATRAIAKLDFAETKKAEVEAMDRAAVQAFDVQSINWP